MRQLATQTCFLIASLLLVSGVSFAQTDEYKEGKHFVRLPMQFASADEGSSDKSKETIEVIEFFSYGCEHCYRFEVFIQDWLKTKASDVSFKREHVGWNSYWKTLARAFYVAEDLKLSPKIHNAMFKAIHDHGIVMNQERKLMTLFDNVEDVDPDTFKEKFWSDEVEERISDAKTKDRLWRIAAHGTPCLVVGGEYLVDVQMVGGKKDELFPVVDFLIERIRSERNDNKAFSQETEG
ncbi:MAG: thiol:disulfide interchange protein DsbA/DsbL [Gammaproteobacteria bacterium]|nr:thiol:disulfide interchange protein DsbA/DsbL [Gammaproteobacteria bacterium]